MNFIDLAAQRVRPQIDAAIERVLSTCGFIMGPEVTNFEKALAAFAGASHALACANGTDALLLPLRAWNIGPGDAVFVPSFTFVASAEVVPLVGASPVFVDVLPDTYNMDPASLEAAIEAVKKDGKLKPRAIIAVDLFGQPADYVAISAIAKRHGLKLMSPPRPSSPPSRSAAMAMAVRFSPMTILSPASSTRSASTARRRPKTWPRRNTTMIRAISTCASA